MQQEEVGPKQYASAQVVTPLHIFLEPTQLTATCRVTLRSTLRSSLSRAYTPTGEERIHTYVRLHDAANRPRPQYPFLFMHVRILYTELYCQLAGYYGLV